MTVTGHSNYPLRLEPELMERIDRLVVAMARAAAGAKVTRASAIRAILVRGLDELEPELNAKPKR